MSQSLHEKYQDLLAALRRHQRILIAFSGGCDSAYLLSAARRTLGRENVLAVTALSASLAIRERDATQFLASALDVEHVCIETDEFSNDSYISNPSNRCFFCKDELFGKLVPLAAARGMALADGFNVSDRMDTRPGFQAARKWNVHHPLDDANLAKHDIRALSRWSGLPTWNKPASPCLSSRIPYGTPVTAAALSQIERAENILLSQGFRVCRVRHFGAQARIEVEPRDLPRLIEPVLWNRIVLQLQEIGYQDIVADPRGFKSGRLNEVFVSKGVPGPSAMAPERTRVGKIAFSRTDIS